MISFFLVALYQTPSYIYTITEMPTTVAQVAKLQAAAMITTKRVGDPEEDASMSVMRPVLSQMNAMGFVTVDSQMGVKETNRWQRAYISGFVSKKMAPALLTRLMRCDDLIALTFPHDASADFVEYGLYNMPRLPLTLMDEDGQELKPVTTMPLGAAQPWEELWISLLPELHLANDVQSMNAVKKDAVTLFVMDTKWGRKRLLFDRVLEIVSSVAMGKKARGNTRPQPRAKGV